eukprot:5560043-Pleurochrysis_carterae.AAC.1
MEAATALAQRERVEAVRAEARRWQERMHATNWGMAQVNQVPKPRAPELVPRADILHSTFVQHELDSVERVPRANDPDELLR